jgi:hypothetical protein
MRVTYACTSCHWQLPHDHCTRGLAWRQHNTILTTHVAKHSYNSLPHHAAAAAACTFAPMTTHGTSEPRGRRSSSLRLGQRGQKNLFVACSPPTPPPLRLAPLLMGRIRVQRAMAIRAIGNPAHSDPTTLPRGPRLQFPTSFKSWYKSAVDVTKQSGASLNAFYPAGAHAINKLLLPPEKSRYFLGGQKKKRSSIYWYSYNKSNVYPKTKNEYKQVKGRGVHNPKKVN